MLPCAQGVQSVPESVDLAVDGVPFTDGSPSSGWCFADVLGRRRAIPESVRPAPEPVSAAFRQPQGIAAAPAGMAVQAKGNGSQPVPGSVTPIATLPGLSGLKTWVVAGNSLDNMNNTVPIRAALGAPEGTGTWAFCSGSALAAGRGGLGKRVVTNEAEVSQPAGSSAARGPVAGAVWRSARDHDQSTGTKARYELLA
jgi:hypothetical protein